MNSYSNVVVLWLLSCLLKMVECGSGKVFHVFQFVILHEKMFALFDSCYHCWLTSGFIFPNSHFENILEEVVSGVFIYIV